MPEFFENIVTSLEVSGKYINVLDDYFTKNVLLKYKWSITKQGRVYTSSYRSDYKRPTSLHRIIYLHRLVYEHYKGVREKGKVIDHIDRNPLNNLPDNLRMVTVQINNANKNKRKNNTSGYTGVYLNGKRDRWIAYIGFRNKSIYLGCSKVKEDAARMVNNAYRQYYPEVNIPNPEVE